MQIVCSSCAVVFSIIRKNNSSKIKSPELIRFYISFQFQRPTRIRNSDFDWGINMCVRVCVWEKLITYQPTDENQNNWFSSLKLNHFTKNGNFSPWWKKPLENWRFIREANERQRKRKNKSREFMALKMTLTWAFQELTDIYSYFFFVFERNLIYT